MRCRDQVGASDAKRRVEESEGFANILLCRSDELTLGFYLVVDSHNAPITGPVRATTLFILEKTT
jgi:hypothetical protein